MTNTTQSKLKAIVIILVFFLTVPAISFSHEDQTQPANPKDLSLFTCKDVMKFEGNDRVLLVTFIHGYYLGKAGTTMFERAKLSDASYKFVDYCKDHPKETALSAMGRFVK